MNPYDYIQDNLTHKRLSLVLHPASIAPDRLPWLNYFLKNPEYEVVRVFGPQHGLHGHTQDNMIEWEGKDFASEPFELISLYGEHRQPTSEMLQNLDAIFFDLQDVGARYYTFIWTLFLLMEALHERSSSVQLYVYDRPNPINGIDIEGPLLDPQYRSFVGLDQIPIRHGLTIGEMALFFQSRFSRVHLNIIQMSGWKRSSYAGNPDGRYWVMPSPNMPTPDTALVYPGQCLLEATNVSEGRGTTRPFEIFGAPWIDADKMCKYLNQQTAGCYFQPWAFQPTFHKYANQTCFGAFIHVTLTERRFVLLPRLLPCCLIYWLSIPTNVVLTSHPMNMNMRNYRSIFSQVISNGANCFSRVRVQLLFGQKNGQKMSSTGRGKEKNLCFMANCGRDRVHEHAHDPALLRWPHGNLSI
jgi:uncharacterized protein YbbC (DUF1343 family)